MNCDSTKGDCPGVARHCRKPRAPAAVPNRSNRSRPRCCSGPRGCGACTSTSHTRR